jgi:hypothetical protein
MSIDLQTLDTEKFSFLTRVMLNAEMVKAERLAAQESATEDETTAPNKKRKFVKIAALIGGVAASAYVIHRLVSTDTEQDENDSDESGDIDMTPDIQE